MRRQESQQRVQANVLKLDQPLENPLPNAASHGHGDHGYQTTDLQHGNHIRTQITPSGRLGKPVSKSSKFHSPEAELEANGRGRTILDDALANGMVVDTFPDPVTGKPTFVNPLNGAPTRHTVDVITTDPKGFGYRIGDYSSKKCAG
jgi:hypothetical protein